MQRVAGSFLPTFRDNLSVPSAFSIWILGPLKSGPIEFPETSVRNYRYSVRNKLQSAFLRTTTPRKPENHSSYETGNCIQMRLTSHFYEPTGLVFWANEMRREVLEKSCCLSSVAHSRSTVCSDPVMRHQQKRLSAGCNCQHIS